MSRVTAKLEIGGVVFAEDSVEHEKGEGWTVAVRVLRGLADTIEAIYDDEKYPPKPRLDAGGFVPLEGEQFVKTNGELWEYRRGKLIKLGKVT